jgi:hypothetical protein
MEQRQVELQHIRRGEAGAPWLTKQPHGVRLCQLAVV